MAAMFFNRSKMPKLVLFRIPQGTFLPSLVPSGQVVSEKKIFERSNIKIAKKKFKKRQEIYTKSYCLTTYILFLVKVAMFFDRSKMPISVLCRISQETFTPSLVPIVQVVSGLEVLERNNI